MKCFQLCEEQVTEIIASDLREQVKDWEADLEKVKQGECTGYVSWDDPEKEQEAIEKLLNSLKITLDYYGG